MEMAYYVYILTNRRRGVLYIGVTNNLARRLAEHKGKLAPGFTNSFGLVRLAYLEEYTSVLEARARERSLKRWRREWKFELVEKLNPDWRDLSDDIPV